MLKAVTAIIDSEPVHGAGAPITVVNPADETPIAEFADADAALVDQAVSSGLKAFERGEWREASVERRQQTLRRIAAMAPATKSRRSKAPIPAFRFRRSMAARLGAPPPTFASSPIISAR